jgi:dTDP-4-dehydrorhamnose reductase
VDKAETDQVEAMKINRDSVAHILKALKNQPECRLIHISTDYVFSGNVARPLNEKDPTGPQSVYGHTKLEGEKLLEGNPNAMVIRTAWLYSVFGKNFVKSMINRMDAHSELRVVYDQTGSPTYAEDLARAIMQIISSVEQGDKDFIPGVFHYSNEGVCSWYDLTKEICRQIKCKVKIRPILSEEYVLPASRPAYTVFNKNKIKVTYGLEIPHWRDSLQECIKNLL